MKVTTYNVRVYQSGNSKVRSCQCQWINGLLVITAVASARLKWNERLEASTEDFAQFVVSENVINIDVVFLKDLKITEDVRKDFALYSGALQVCRGLWSGLWKVG